VDVLIRDLPLKVLRKYRGKLGTELWGINCIAAGQVAALPHEGVLAISLQRAKDL